MNNYDDIKRFKEKLNMEGIDYKEIAENNPHKSSQNWAIIKQVASADEPFHPLEQGLSTQPTPSPVSQKEFTVSALDKPAASLQAVRPESRQKAPSPPPAFPTAPSRDSSFSSPLMSALDKIMPAAPKANETPDEAPASGDNSNAADEFSGQAAGGRMMAQQSSGGPSIFDDVNRGLPANIPAAQASDANQPAAGPSLFDSVNRSLSANAPAAQDNRAHRPATGPSLFDNLNRDRPANAPAARDTGANRPAAGASSGYGMRFNKLFSRKSRLPAGTLPGRDMSLSLLLENIALCR